MAQRKPSIPNFLNRKIYKTGQTRGADDDQIFQNRVNRNSTVLIPFNIWEKIPTVRDIEYENEFIVLISPNEYNSESYSKYSNLKDISCPYAVEWVDKVEEAQRGDAGFGYSGK